ncbi:unnamed protein product [Rotaria sp. Silwood2]|nr:unnamed protein product [Rotaria sp. Silwood2]
MCPPSYYGDLCQYQNERVSVTLGFIRADRCDVYFMIIILINDNQLINSLSYGIKLNRYLLYSTRPKNISNKYSIRIDAFEKHFITFRGSWHLSISFLFLSVNRISALLYILYEPVPILSNCFIKSINSEFKLSAFITMIMFFVGIINGFLSILTFKRKTSQEVDSEIYLIASSIPSLSVILLFSLKFWFLIYSYRDLIGKRLILFSNCMIIELLLKLLLYIDNWLNCCFAGKRAFSPFKGIHFDKRKNRKTAKWMILCAIIINIILLIPHMLYLHLYDDIKEEHTWHLSLSNGNSNELSNVDIIASLEISNLNEGEIEPLSTSELDEILKYFPTTSISQEEEQEESSNVLIDFDFKNSLIDCQTINNDDLFVQMLLDNDYSSSSTTETTFDDLFLSDILPSSLSLSSSSLSSSLPRITSVDEFDAFLRDFTLNLSSHQHEVSTSIS